MNFYFTSFANKTMGINLDSIDFVSFDRKEETVTLSYNNGQTHTISGEDTLNFFNGITKFLGWKNQGGGDLIYLHPENKDD